ncbi:MAG: hypothetical protein HWN67_03660 [Candidatus Helarchaeota archaeon]|nr:hypothetical protein [Candidatus Helarchaeota archaeon]
MSEYLKKLQEAKAKKEEKEKKKEGKIDTDIATLDIGVPLIEKTEIVPAELPIKKKIKKKRKAKAKAIKKKPTIRQLMMFAELWEIEGYGNIKNYKHGVRLIRNYFNALR